MADTWIGTVMTTRPKYTKGYTDLTLRKRLRLAMLRRRGRVQTGQSGAEWCSWQVAYSDTPVQGYSDGNTLNFANHQAYKRFRVNWRGIVTPDTMSLMQFAQNKGDNQLIRGFQEKANRIMKSTEKSLHAEMFKDGEAPGRENLPQGLETFLGDDGATVAGDLIARPSDTYGLDAHSTVPGVEGSWSAIGTAPNATIGTDWPNGSGDPEYDWNSPLLMNATSDAWGTGSILWEANCWRVISQAITWMNTNNGMEGKPSIISLDKQFFQAYKNHHEVIRRINIPHRESQDLGFGDTLNQDGVAIQSEFDVPVNTGYIENLSTVTLSSLFPDLFFLVHGSEVGGTLEAFLRTMDIRTLSMLLVGGFFGAFEYQPKYCGKIKAYA